MAGSWLQPLRVFDMACLFPAGCAALVSPMAFDSGTGALNWVLFVYAASAPVVVLFAVLASGHLRSRNRPVAAFAVAALPLYSAILYALLALGEVIWRRAT